MSPFEYIKAINSTKENLIVDDKSEKEYTPYIVNRGLSYFHDTVIQANVMNQYPLLPKKWQFQFLLNSITKKKRFSKWSKKDDESESILLVKEYFGYSSEKAKEALKILSVEQLNTIREKINKGGK